jgi:hypothetical protein
VALTRAEEQSPLDDLDDGDTDHAIDLADAHLTD